MRLWPISESWIVNLYGEDENPPDILFIGIDDETGTGFSGHIDPILKVCKQFHPDLSFWLLFLESKKFDVWHRAVSFSNFIEEGIAELLDKAKSGGGNQKYFEKNKLLLDGLKNKIIKAPIKIWLIDLLDAVGNDSDSIELINSLRRKNENCVIFSQQGQDLTNKLPQFEGVNYFQKLLNVSDDSIRINVYPHFSAFLPTTKLSEICTGGWHNMRFLDNGNRQTNINPQPHHWCLGCLLDCRCNTSLNEDGKEDMWGNFNNITIGMDTLQKWFTDRGLNKNIMFQSNTAIPSIRELLQTCSCGKNLTNYLERIKGYLESIGRQSNPQISVELINNTVTENYLWFNICSLYNAMREIIRSYMSELAKMQTVTKAIATPKIKIIINEVKNSKKGIEILIKEDPLIVECVTWPLSQGRNVISKGTENILKAIKNSGAKEIIYKAEDDNGNTKVKKIDIEQALANGNNAIMVSDNNDFTFKWFIEATITQSAFNCLNNNTWSVKVENHE